MFVSLCLYNCIKYCISTCFVSLFCIFCICCIGRYVICVCLCIYNIHWSMLPFSRLDLYLSLSSICSCHPSIHSEMISFTLSLVGFFCTHVCFFLYLYLYLQLTSTNALAILFAFLARRYKPKFVCFNICPLLIFAAILPQIYIGRWENNLPEEKSTLLSYSNLDSEESDWAEGLKCCQEIAKV